VCSIRRSYWRSYCDNLIKKENYTVDGSRAIQMQKGRRTPAVT
jgi:hypothetical protein